MLAQLAPVPRCCRLDCVLPSLQQYVDIPTRRGNMLDLCYGNITVHIHRSDLLTTTSSVYFRCTNKSWNVTNHSATAPPNGRRITQLQGSLACTDWDTCDGDLDDRVSVITDYIKFCIRTTIPSKTIRIYPNSKPWITPQIKQSLKEKHKSFRHKDWASLKATNRNIRNEVFKAKLDYKNKLISTTTSYLKYSDDTAILALLSDNQSTLDYHNTVTHFTKWCADNHLQINVNKTKELLFSPPSPQHPTTINTQTVETVDSFKYLGITMDNKLTFDQHM